MTAAEGMFFPALDVAARRLRLDGGELGEAVLHKLDMGYEEMEAIEMSIIEELQRRSAYHGKIKEAVERGVIFQLRVDDEGKAKRRGKSARHVGKGMK